MKRQPGAVGRTRFLMPASAIASLPAVAIPVYRTALSAAEWLSIERTVGVLGHHAVFLVGPERLAGWMQAQCAPFGGRLRWKAFDDRFFDGIKGYNLLMMSRVFYGAFAGHSHLLIAQTDSLVVSDQLEAWCASGFSYVGAPWFEGGSEPREPLRLVGVGNGGFSLRRLDHFDRVLATPRRVPNTVKSRSGSPAALPQLVRWLKHGWWLAYNRPPLLPTSNEDVFWGVLVPAVCPFFRVPAPERALDFAFEVAPRRMLELNGHRLPFGCHAWERCDRAFWAEQLPFVREAGLS